MSERRQYEADQILDWHLRQLSQEQRAEFEARLRAEPDLRERSDRLGSLLRPLDLGAPVSVPPNLSDRILARVDSAASRAGAGSRVSREGSVWSFLWRRREPVAIAACLAAIFGILAPSFAELRHRAQRAVCADHLAGLFRATTSYQDSFAGALPYAGGRADAAWLPSGPSDRPFASNSRHAFLLLKSEQGASPEQFVCPSDERGVPAAASALAQRTDFPSAANVSYSTLNLSGPRPVLRPARRVAYIGDPNPLFVRARFDATVDADHANSPAHRGRGQTVLALDGSATWQKSPVFGAGRDNVWLIDDLRRYDGTESPRRADDAQLIPGFPDGRAAPDGVGAN